MKILQALLLICVSAGPVLADDDQKAEVDVELKKLLGTWRAVSACEDGKPLPEKEVTKVSIHFADDGIRFKPFFLELVDDRNSDSIEIPDGVRLPVKLDPKKKPKHLDIEVGYSGWRILNFKLGGHPVYDKCIYSLEGDVLKICYGHKQRPAKFETKADDGFSLVVFRREP